jgi:hypothetical protein
VKLTTHLYLELKSRMVELYLHSPIYLHGVVLEFIIKHRENFTSNDFSLHVKSVVTRLKGVAGIVPWV